MNISIDKFGLSKRIQLKQLSDNEIAIVKKVKSRIIQKDALKIIEIADKIKAVSPNLKVSLICSNNICSKSVKLLENNGLKILYESE